MAEVIYQVTRFGKGFQGPGQTSLDKAIQILERKLERIDGPYGFQGKPKQTFDRDELLAEIRKRAPELDVGPA